MNSVIGIDFDNTIVNYNAIIHKTAVEWRLIKPDFKKNKKEIRDIIRKLPNGEMAWQKVQVCVYGKAMAQATLIKGVKEFFRACKDAGIPTFIVSHKTEYARLDDDNINLREAALLWMRNKGFFHENGIGLFENRVYFESTRQEKINRIKKLRCTHFIDDLEETFLEESFPDDVEKILYTSSKTDLNGKEIKIFSQWEEIHDYLLRQAVSRNE